MPCLTLLLLLPPVMMGCRRIRRGGTAAWRLYRRLSVFLGTVIILSMAAQETLLYLSGQLHWSTGLPLHLCSLMGVIALPALMTRRDTLLHVLLCAGLPGAALALLFPAVAVTPWPRLTAFFFCLMHAGVALAPLLPLSLGWRPRPSGAFSAFLFLLAAGCLAALINRLTGGNYLFLAGPVAGTPLVLLHRWGGHVYRLLLALLAALLLTGEAALISLLTRRRRKRPPAREN